MDIKYTKFDTKKELYHNITNQLLNIIEETYDLYAILANTSALLKLFLDDINWVGFYLLKNEALVLGPFQGKPAVSNIQIGSGVCGTAVKEQRLQRVDDVSSCCNHITCDFASRSEIVVPIGADSKIFGVIDIDSPIYARFDEEDEIGLSKIADVLSDVFKRLL